MCAKRLQITFHVNTSENSSDQNCQFGDAEENYASYKKAVKLGQKFFLVFSDPIYFLCKKFHHLEYRID